VKHGFEGEAESRDSEGRLQLPVLSQRQQVVTVNRFVVSVTEFMQRSLDSFDVGRQVCESGLRMCKEQIEKIKQRKHQQQCDRVIAIAQIDNQLERGLCYE
ncbi:hypothetical protein C7B79_25605, partial [Chroococcidiopsis cubana CCALA 043]